MRRGHHLADPASVRGVRARRLDGWTRAAGATAPDFPPQRAGIVALARLEPVAEGLHITHWSSRDLARQAVADGLVPAIGDREVRRILAEVDLQPRRTRYWKTARLDDRFKERAEKVPRCYANAARLARRGAWVVCADEVPNFQALGREPIRRAVPGEVERMGFEYVRHGTVDILAFLAAHRGRMEATCPGRNDADHYVAALKAFRRRHRLRGVYLIHDNGPSHIAAATRGYLDESRGRWRPRPTPAHASWLDQAELLIRAFSPRYPERRSWSSREEVMAQAAVAWPEYNRLYAHPFEWTWTNQKMRRWYAEHRS